MSSEKAATVVVDLDGTLFVDGRISRLMWRLISLLQRRGRAAQRPNRALIKYVEGYQHVIVLTSRDLKDIDSTRLQIKRLGLRVDQIISCPRRSVFTEWKRDTLNLLGKSTRIDWIDDVLGTEEWLPIRASLLATIRPIEPAGSAENQLSSHKTESG